MRVLSFAEIQQYREEETDAEVRARLGEEEWKRFNDMLCSDAWQENAREEPLWPLVAAVCLGVAVLTAVKFLWK